MAERQLHGFEYEKLIISKNNLITTNKYIDKWDAYEMYNGILVPVSIKCIGHKSSIDFGDFKRQTEITEDFILYIGRWKSNKSLIIEEYKLFIRKDNWNRYFGDNSIIEDMLLEMKNISNNYTDDGKWLEYRNKYKFLYGESIIALRFKRDHKKQKRIQCGINFRNFINVVMNDNKVISSFIKQ